MLTTKWDVVYAEKHATIEPHFCREAGCYGTNEDHGFTWDEACDIVAAYYEEEAKLWRERDSVDCFYYKQQMLEASEQ